MNNRSFQSPGMTINSVRVIGPEFSSLRRTSFEHINNVTVRNTSVNVTIIGDEANNANRSTTTIRARPSVMNSESNYQSHPSPDEIVIKGRGRRSLPVKWSPIPIESPQKTPLSALIKNSPKKGLITLRSSPRKRLQLNDGSSDVYQSRRSLMSYSPLARRTSSADLTSRSPTPDKAMTKLSRDQLVHVLNSIVDKHPYIKEEIGSILSAKEENEAKFEDSGISSKNTTFETIKSDNED